MFICNCIVLNINRLCCLGFVPIIEKNIALNQFLYYLAK